MERLQKVLARAGVASRREAEQWILDGRVQVNGRTVTKLGTKVDPEADRVTVDGLRVGGEEPKLHFMLHKPRGYITALSDPRGRPHVGQLLPRVKARVYPVGRLDYDAEGLLLLTNDGELAHRLMHPRHRVPKTYLVKVRGIPEERDLERLRRGVRLEDGRTLPCEVAVAGSTGQHAWLEVTVYEGRYHLLKRMGLAVGHPVSKLKRVSFAGLRLGTLKPGACRPLTPGEVAQLKKAATRATAPPTTQPAAPQRSQPARSRAQLATPTIQRPRAPTASKSSVPTGSRSSPSGPFPSSSVDRQEKRRLSGDRGIG
ncbi:MAG: pseudouridine synthase [Deltaproteobacteria bacterium]|nr:pseudouridine synthase [Deltaproteobacteria bacterium]